MNQSPKEKIIFFQSADISDLSASWQNSKKKRGIEAILLEL
ncbi:Uncharacterized protein dnm_075610 [Desulfonema magnum]|uniref:Uncharacterized protein n=1 Tax=Desulfonema magnum TaxID=45655 RepID=A0A975BTU9_9BACT|nr:Uncharacterized protein dnm_075610 [Desulfonema magnum]